MINPRSILMTTTVITLMALPAFAQQSPPSPAMPMPMHQGMAMSGNASPSTMAYQAANDKMMKGMTANMTGDADRDFVGGMIPHHAGAIDMAKIELQYGKDPALRALAQGIIAAQEKEIAEMTAWQKAHPVKP